MARRMLMDFVRYSLTLFVATAVFTLNSLPADAVDLTALTRPALIVKLSPLIDGQISELHVKDGDTVSKGSLLLKLEDGVQAARVALAQKSSEQSGAVQRAEVQLERAKSKLKRLKGAHRSSVPSWEIEEAEFQAKLAKAELSTARMSLSIERGKYQLERKLLEQYSITAPFDGRIVLVDVVKGSTVKRTDVLVTLASEDVIEAIAYAPFSLRSKLILGRDYSIKTASLQSNKLIPTAKLIFVDHILEPASQTFRIKFLIESKSTEFQFQVGSQLKINIEHAR